MEKRLLKVLIAGLLLQLAPVESTYTLQVRAQTYRNQYSKDSRGYCCESYSRSNCVPWWCGSSCRCDNRFNFCLRSYGTRQDNNANNCPLGSRRTSVVYSNNDYFNFPTRMGGVTNPMSFTGSSWPVSSGFNCRECRIRGGIYRSCILHKYIVSKYG